MFIRRFTEELFQKKIYLILLMTQCMVHCVQFLYKIFIFNPFLTEGVEILPALRSSCPYFNLHTILCM